LRDQIREHANTARPLHDLFSSQPRREQIARAMLGLAITPDKLAAGAKKADKLGERRRPRAMLSLLTSVKAALWDEAPAEQRKLTLQLGRNSFYFATAVFFIKQFGEQVAV